MISEKFQEFNEQEEFSPKEVTIKTLNFEADELVPNSKLSVLVYDGIFNFGSLSQKEVEDKISELVSQNGWYRDWTYHVYPFLHYHSTAHEGLVVFSGETTIQLGGKTGKMIRIKKGDAIIIPAGVGHERILGKGEKTEDFIVFGIYPDGQKWDFISESSENGGMDIANLNVRKEAEKNINNLELPSSDPFYDSGRLLDNWK